LAIKLQNKKSKLKNRDYFDFQIQYLSFTYDSNVLEKIIAHDQPLNIGESNNVKFGNITKDLEKDASPLFCWIFLKKMLI